MRTGFMKITLAALLMAGIVSCASNSANHQLTTEDIKSVPTTIKFDTLSYNFGDVTAGEKVETIFEFTNTGKSKLIISNVQASCGCTIPEKPNEPIDPGKRGRIKVKFDTAGKPEGRAEQSVTVTANTVPDRITLTINANIKK